MAEQAVIGFDARDLTRPDERWDEDRRGLFLLQHDVERPLSAGIFTWPSLFDTGQVESLPGDRRRYLGFAGIKTPEWIGANGGLWENLDLMRSQLRINAVEINTDYAIVAITWLSRHNFRESGIVGPYAEPTDPGELSPGWRFLGYDVGDESRISGLTECGYLPEEILTLRPRWAPYLNDNHLFVDEEQAFAFSLLSNERVPEHRPFYVYGLYLVDEVRRSKSRSDVSVRKASIEF